MRRLTDRSVGAHTQEDTGVMRVQGYWGEMGWDDLDGGANNDDGRDGNKDGVKGDGYGEDGSNLNRDDCKNEKDGCKADGHGGHWMRRGLGRSQ